MGAARTMQRGPVDGKRPKGVTWDDLYVSDIGPLQEKISSSKRIARYAVGTKQDALRMMLRVRFFSDHRSKKSRDLIRCGATAKIIAAAFTCPLNAALRKVATSY